MTYLLLILGVIFIIVGVFGVLVPFLPGIPLAFLGAFLLAYSTSFGLVSKNILWLLASLAFLSVCVDYFSGIIGARLGRASIFGVVGAVVGGFIGFFTAGLLGVVLGPAIGVLIFELLAKNGSKKAMKATSSTLLASLVGLIVNSIIALIFVVILTLAIVL